MSAIVLTRISGNCRVRYENKRSGSVHAISTGWVSCIIIVSTNKLWAGNEKSPGKFDFFPITIQEPEKKKGQKIKGKRERAKKRELTQGEKKRKKSNGGSKANLHRSLQNYGDLKWRFTGKSSKFDLPINKSTYKYINLSY